MTHQNLLKNLKATKYQTVLFVVALLVFDVLFLSARQTKTIAVPQLPVYSREVLSEYDGTDSSKPILLALDGLIYDVSMGRDSYYAPGKPYHALVGADASALLHIAGGDIISKKYPVVGRLLP